MLILGIDPGYDRLGVAVVEQSPSGNRLVYSGCIVTDKDSNFSQRLRSIGEDVGKIVKKYKPTCAALEKTFFSKNKKTAVSVSEARGVVLYEIAKSNIDIFEYSPPEVKVAVTGYGKSSKSDIEIMVPKLIKISKKIQYDDEYDAIAVALTHAAQNRVISQQI